MLLFGVAGFIALYALQRLQWYLPFNPQGQAGIEKILAFNTSVSFVTNTNWQSYVPETTMGFGGVGSGLYGMLAFAIITMFVAGLMVGRTPEYLGKKLEAKEVKMTMLSLLSYSLSILGWTALAAAVPQGLAGIANNGPHGFSEILYFATRGARS
jgi:K+-transporting ATPase A subunit